MKNKLVLLGLIGLLVGCGSNNISSSSNKQSSSTQISTNSVSSSFTSTLTTFDGLSDADINSAGFSL